MVALKHVVAASCVGLLAVAGAVVPTLGQAPRDGGVNRTPQKGAAGTPVFQPAIIGTIDIDLVKEGYEKYKMHDEELRGYYKSLQAEFMKLNMEMKQKMEQLQKLLPTSPEAKKLQDQLTEMEIKRKAFAENKQRELDQRATEVEATVYNEIQKMVEAVAGKYGLSFVLRSTQTKQLGADDPRSVAMAQSRAVIFSDPKLDITEIVLFNMNRRYKAMNPGAEAGKAAVNDADPATRPAAANPR